MAWEPENKKKMGDTKAQQVLQLSIYDFTDVMSITHAILLIFAFFDSFLNVLLVCIYPQNCVHQL